MEFNNFPLNCWCHCSEASVDSASSASSLAAVQSKSNTKNSSGTWRVYIFPIQKLFAFHSVFLEFLILQSSVILDMEFSRGSPVSSLNNIALH